MATIETIMFRKSDYSLKRAKLWLRDHIYKPIGDRSDTSYYYVFNVAFPKEGAKYQKISWNQGKIIMIRRYELRPSSSKSPY